jgi:hypothetical protein
MVGGEVEALRTCPHPPASLELDALPHISALIGDLVWQRADKSGHQMAGLSRVQGLLRELA